MINEFTNIKYGRNITKRSNVSIGDKFGKLTIIGEGFYLTHQETNRKKHYCYVVCQCDCGTIKVLMLKHITRIKRTQHATVSCGCYFEEINSNPSKNYCTYNDNTVNIHCKHGDVIVDKNIFEEKIKEYCIFSHVHENKKYLSAIIRINNEDIRLGRYLLNYPENMEVDHINSNTLDNRLENLRIVTRIENMRNIQSYGETSKYKGVRWNKKDKKWHCSITNNKKEKYLGSFKNEIEAALVYDQKARKTHKEYGRYNFPLPGEQSAIKDAN